MRERQEQERQLVCGDAHARILDFKAHTAPALLLPSSRVAGARSAPAHRGALLPSSRSDDDIERTAAIAAAMAAAAMAAAARGMGTRGQQRHVQHGLAARPREFHAVVHDVDQTPVDQAPAAVGTLP